MIVHLISKKGGEIERVRIHGPDGEIVNEADFAKVLEWNCQAFDKGFFDGGIIVEQTKHAYYPNLDDVEVSTVMLTSITMLEGDKQPDLFETMIFGGEFNGFTERLATVEQAIYYHRWITFGGVGMLMVGGQLTNPGPDDDGGMDTPTPSLPPDTIDHYF